jgi:hypothetical protein
VRQQGKGKFNRSLKLKAKEKGAKVTPRAPIFCRAAKITSSWQRPKRQQQRPKQRR